ncbi:MAG: hypothetical protein H5U17_03510 [Defluviimonas sp.]|nr:hypothetical protein [Defluviimonas sp.]
MPRPIEGDLTPEAAALIGRLRRRQLVAKLRYGLVPGRARRARLIHDATYRSEAELIAHSFASGHGHLPDMTDPKGYPEKIRWLIVNHRNPLISLVSDKIAVRAYLRYCGATIAAPGLIGTGHDPDEILHMPLPDSFALKASNASGHNHFHEGGPVDRRALARIIAGWKGTDYWRKNGELFYRPIPFRFLLEEFLPHRRRKLEYKVFCFHGEPAFISAIVARQGARLMRAIYRPDWSKARFGTRGLGISRDEVPRPAELPLLLEEARRLSQHLIFARVDFLHFDDRLAFSEITFANDGARRPIDPPEMNLAIGRLIDLSREEAYLAEGRRIAAELGWPGMAAARQAANDGGNDGRAGLSAGT